MVQCVALRVLRAAGAALLLAAAAACAPAAAPVRAPQPELPEIRCGPADDADFDADGHERLWRYLDWLAEAYGPEVGLRPQDVALAIVRGPAKPGPVGVTAAEVGCGGDRYRITLYRDALSGRPLSVTYDTLAHEFYHLVQIRRDGLACQARDGERAGYEQEAMNFARGIVPACRRDDAR